MAAHPESHREAGEPGDQAAHRQGAGVSQRGIAAAPVDRHLSGDRREIDFGTEGLHEDGEEP